MMCFSEKGSSLSVSAVPLLCFLLLTIFHVAPTRVQACGGTPPPPICGKTVVLAKAAPGPLLLTGGGAFNLPVTVFVAVTAGVCPAPVSAQITISLTCTPDPNAGGTLNAVVVPGFNNLLVPVTVPAGPPRICTVAGSAVVTFSDGSMIRAGGDTVVCIVEPAPDNMDVPRLDIQHLTPAIQVIHPGDQSRHVYRITNNDPDQSFTGALNVGMRNAVQIPSTVVPSVGTGEGPFSVANPTADHFPIAFEDLIPPELCLPLPPAPEFTVPGEIFRPIILEPGQSQDVVVVSRAWGLCASGTCSESIVRLEGLFSDNSEGLACTGAAVGVSGAMPPSFDWANSGQVGLPQVPDPFTPIGFFQFDPPGFDPFQISMGFQSSDVNVGGNPLEAQDYMERQQTGSLRGQIGVFGPFNATDTIVGRAQLVFGSPDDSVRIELVALSLVSVDPITYPEGPPSAVGTLALDHPPFDGIPDSFFDIHYDVSVFPYQGSSFLNRGNINIDTSEIFTDGFESGNVSAWSYTGSDQRGGGEIIDGIQVYYDVRGFWRMGEIPFPCPTDDPSADFNGDFLVNADDAGVLFGLFRQSGESPQDRDEDGLITVLDVSDVVNRLGCQEALPLSKR